MDHRAIEERDLVRAYCSGKLSEEESLEFEAHFVDCASCLQNLELLRNFLSGLKDVTAEDAALGSSFAGWMGRLASLGAWKRTAVLAGAACLLIVIPALISTWKISRLRHQLEETQLASADWEHRYTELQAN